MKLRKLLIPLAAGSVVLAGVGIADAATTPHKARATTGRAAIAAGLLKRVEHGTLVVKGKGGKDVTVTIARGTATTVSATSLTVTSADAATTTFAISTTTRVRQLGSGLTTASSLHTGERVSVVGVAGTATRIIIARAAGA